MTGLDTELKTKRKAELKTKLKAEREIGSALTK